MKYQTGKRRRRRRSIQGSLSIKGIVIITKKRGVMGFYEKRLALKTSLE